MRGLNTSTIHGLKSHFDGNEEIVTVNGISGALINRAEIENWRGPIPLHEYPINDDPNPEIIRRRLNVPVLDQTQEVTIRYLEPPTPPPPGEIIIQQEKPMIPPAAPPIIIRQAPPRLQQKEALVIREAPPKMPAPIARKIVKILGPKVPPPPRKVIIERPPPVAEKAQQIIIERWLAPKQQARKVIFEGVGLQANYQHPRVRNEIIEYDAPEYRIKKEFRDLGVHRADPNEYWAKYGNTLIESHNLPDFVRDIRPPNGLILASDVRSQVTRPLLEGDIQWLSHIDLAREGLSEYSSYIQTSSSGGSGFYERGRGGATETYYERSTSSPPRGSTITNIIPGAVSSATYDRNVTTTIGYPSTSTAIYKSTTITDSSAF